MTLGIRRITGSCNKVLVQSFRFPLPVIRVHFGRWQLVGDVDHPGDVLAGGGVGVHVALVVWPPPLQPAPSACSLPGFYCIFWSPAAALTVGTCSRRIKSL